MVACILIAMLLAFFFIYRYRKNNKAEPSKTTSTYTGTPYDSPMSPGFRDYVIDWLKEEGESIKIEDFEGRIDALCCIFSNGDRRNRARFFAYAVDCERRGRTMGDIRKERNREKYDQFADYVLQHDDLVRSLDARYTADFWDLKSVHNAKVYRAAKEWFP